MPGLPNFRSEKTRKKHKYRLDPIVAYPSLHFSQENNVASCAVGEQSPYFFAPQKLPTCTQSMSLCNIRVSLIQAWECVTFATLCKQHIMLHHVIYIPINWLFFPCETDISDNLFLICPQTTRLEPELLRILTWRVGILWGLDPNISSTKMNIYTPSCQGS